MRAFVSPQSSSSTPPHKRESFNSSIPPPLSISLSSQGTQKLPGSNCYGFNATYMKRVADAFVTLGLKNAGNARCCWRAEPSQHLLTPTHPRCRDTCLLRLTIADGTDLQPQATRASPCGMIHHMLALDSQPTTTPPPCPLSCPLSLLTATSTLTAATRPATATARSARARTAPVCFTRPPVAASHPTRSPVQNNLQVNKTVFPNGIKPVADYIHSKGLKFGIYSDAGGRRFFVFSCRGPQSINAELALARGATPHALPSTRRPAVLQSRLRPQRQRWLPRPRGAGRRVVCVPWRCAFVASLPASRISLVLLA